ncbi:SPOR domain-containing protein [Alphaproteobacteria bacterium KMM 3653]|uniref:SPOR domain-containing protein n=1 Tax=Harenicola maris TaxID=2841044 RepID=A0AAP2CPT2_9RHOB|nr:SPOR domain-containing protein [Harenicola maris]
MTYPAQAPRGGAYTQAETSYITEDSAAGSPLVRWTGAAVSLALIAGLCVWSYQVISRDVNGIPVVRALDGPMRVSPDDPGGMVTAHQGLSVTEVAAEGAAGQNPDRVALAPDTPALTDEDQTLAALARPPEPRPSELSTAAEADDAALATPETVAAVNLPEDVDTSDPVAVALALAEQLANGAEPLDADAEAEAAAKPAVISGTIPGVRRSPRPSLRPASLRRPASAPATIQNATDLSAPATVQTASLNQTGGITPQEASVPIGTRLVQLGAFDSPDDASRAWAVLSGRFDALMEGKRRIIQEAQSGGRTFYRLRALGFEDIADARQFCAALVAERADCIPVVAR